LVGLDKTYEATLELGATSETYDTEGTITPTLDALPPTEADIERVLNQFRGGYEQKAPLHSAKKIQGKKLYELARSGQATEDMRPSKYVSIPTLLVTRYSFPKLELQISCSSGTYIRSLADDIGRALGVGAYCQELRRTKIGRFDVKDAVTLERLKTDGVLPHLLPSDP
jgi:tRNA pseudouridine55 synthase